MHNGIAKRENYELGATENMYNLFQKLKREEEPRQERQRDVSGVFKERSRKEKFRYKRREINGERNIQKL